MDVTLSYNLKKVCEGLTEMKFLASYKLNGVRERE